MAKSKGTSPAAIIVGLIFFTVGVAVLCGKNDPFDKKPPVFTTPSAAPSNTGE